MTLLLAIILILLGILLLYFIGRRRFYRRSFTGLQQFRSYEAGLAVRSLEFLLRLFAIILLLTGVFLVVVFLYNR